MRALAEFVMRGRTQAIAVAALGVATLVFAWVSAAVVGLVMLRRGPRDGLAILVWALLPALAIALFGADIGPAMALMGTALAALVLRLTRSWPLALVASVLIGLLTALLLHTVASSYVEQLLVTFNQFLAELNQRSGPNGAQAVKMSAAQVCGLLGFGAVSSTVSGLLLARWWQAMLYNPGGFRTEFHQLRLPLPVAVGLIAVGLLINSLGPEYHLWALICVMPLVVAGFALGHGVVGLKGWGRGALVALYIGWLLVDWVKAGLLLLALIDSGLNFRARLVRPAAPD